MQWRIINRLNEFLITRTFCIQRIKVSPPIETNRHEHFAYPSYPRRMLFCPVWNCTIVK